MPLSNDRERPISATRVRRTRDPLHSWYGDTVYHRDPSGTRLPTRGRASLRKLTVKGRAFMIEAWDAGAYRDVREIWEQAAIQAGDDKFKCELIRGLNALTGHLEYDIGQIRSALSVLSELSSLIESGKRKTDSPAALSGQRKSSTDS